MTTDTTTTDTTDTTIDTTTTVKQNGRDPDTYAEWISSIPVWEKN